MSAPFPRCVFRLLLCVSHFRLRRVTSRASCGYSVHSSNTVREQFRSTGVAPGQALCAAKGSYRPAQTPNLGPLFPAFGLYTPVLLDYRDGTDILARTTSERHYARRLYDSLHWMPVGT